MSPFPGQPSSVCLPSTSTLVEDPDEEIFLLYVRKQSTAPPAPSPASATARGSAPPGGLGFLSTKQDLLEVELRITPPIETDASLAGEKAVRKHGKGSGKGKDKVREVLVNVEVQQSLEMLRNRKGDTGSVLWRVSVHLAHHLLTSHHFPSPSRPPLLPHLATSRVLELGSGTGFLGLALLPLTAHWTFTDQLTSLPLVARNLDRNGVAGGDLQELDWVVEGGRALGPGLRTGRGKAEDGTAPDVIVAADCIYNPSLAGPLARTIDRVAGEGTVALVASELRDAEPLEAFLKEWVEGCGWTVVRLEAAERSGGGPADEVFGKEFVVWVGWKEPAK